MGVHFGTIINEWFTCDVHDGILMRDGPVIWVLKDMQYGQPNAIIQNDINMLVIPGPAKLFWKRVDVVLTDETVVHVVIPNQFSMLQHRKDIFY